MQVSISAWCAANATHPKAVFASTRKAVVFRRLEFLATRQSKTPTRFAKSRNGECLSTTYEGDKVPLLWRCADGHSWPATLSSVNKLNSWCGCCAGVTKLSIRDAQDAAAAKGGECLSEESANANADLLWRCRHGHEWKACLNSVKNKDSWCLLCAGQVVTLQDAEGVAAERGGRIPLRQI